MKKPKQKQYYSIKVEGTAPVIAEFRIYAEDEKEAIKIFDTQPHLIQLIGPPKPDMLRLQKKKVTVKNLMTGMIEWVKNF